MADESINIKAKATLEGAERSALSAQQLAEKLQQLRAAAEGKGTYTIKIDAQTGAAETTIEASAKRINAAAANMEEAGSRRVRTLLTQSEAFLKKRGELVNQLTRNQFTGVQDTGEARAIAQAGEKLRVLGRISESIKRTIGNTLTAETRDLIKDFNQLETNPRHLIRTYQRGQQVRPEEIDRQLINREQTFGAQIAQRQDRLTFRELVRSGAVPRFQPEQAYDYSNQQIDRVISRYYKRLEQIPPTKLAEIASSQAAVNFPTGPSARGPRVSQEVFGIVPTRGVSKLQEYLDAQVTAAMKVKPELPIQEQVRLNRERLSKEFIAGGAPLPPGVQGPQAPTVWQRIQQSIASTLGSERGAIPLNLTGVGKALGLAKPEQQIAFERALTQTTAATQKLGTAETITAEQVASRRAASGLPPGPPIGGGGGGAGGGPPIIPPSGGGAGGPLNFGGNVNKAYTAYQGGAISNYTRSFSTALGSLVNYAGAAALIYGFASAVSTATSNAVKFEEEMTRLRGILPGQKLSDAFTIEQGVIEAARKYGATLNDVTNIAQAFVQTGRTAAQVVQDLDRTFAATTGLGITINEAQELLIAVRSLTFEYDNQRSAIDVDIFDRIAAAQERAAASASDLTNALKTAGPVAHELRGQYVGLVDEIDLVLAATGQIVQKTGLPGAQVATSLRNTFARLGRPEVIKALQQVGGVNLGTPESGGTQLRPLYEVIGELSKAYNKLKGTADLQRLLTQLAGSRQTNAIVALLDDYSTVTQNAEHAALAFGNAQSRTDLVLQTTAVGLRKFRTNMESLGVSLVGSAEAGGLFRVAMAGVNSLLGFLGKNSDTVVIKLALFSIAIVGLVRNLKLLSTAMSYTLGAKALGELKTVSAAFGGFGDLVVSSARKMKVALGAETAGAGIFRGLISAIGPGGIIALTIAALGGLIYAIEKVAKAGEKAYPLAVTPLNTQDISQQNIPQLADFIDKANKFGISSQQLFSSVDEVSKTTLDTLNQIGKPLDKLNRSEIITVLYPNLRKNVKGFAEDIDSATAAMSKQEKEAYVIQQIMELIGKAAFIQSGVLGANYNKFIQAAESARQKMVDSISRLSQGGGGKLVPVIQNIGFGEHARTVISPIYDQIKKALDDIDSSVSPLILDFIKAAQSVGLLTKNLDELKGQATVSAALEEIGKRVTGATPRQRNALIANFTSQLSEEFQVGKLVGPVAGLFDPKGPSAKFLEALESIYVPAVNNLGKALQSNLGGQAALSVDRLLRNSSTGVAAVVNNMRELVTQTKNPLTDFIQNLYLSLKAIDLNAEAAKRFGLAFNEPLTRLQTLEKFAAEAYQIPLQTTKELLEVQQQINQLRVSAALVGGRRPGSQVPFGEAAQVGQETEGDRARRALETLEIRRNELTKQLVTFTQDPSFQSTIEQILSTIDITSPSAANIRAVLERIKSKEGNIADNLEELFKGLDELLGKARDKYLDQVRRLTSVETTKTIQQEGIKAYRDLRQARIQQRLGSATFGLEPIESLSARRQSIEEQRSLEIEQARLQYQIELSALEDKRIIMGKAYGETQYEQDRIHLQSQLQVAEAQANINAQRETELEIVKAIGDEEQKFNQQVDTNLKARVQGIREVLLDVDKLTKGKSLQIIFGAIGRQFAERQVDQFLKVFDSKKGIGKILGGAGEVNPITTAAKTHADLVYSSIVRAAQYHGEVIQAAITGQPIPGAGGNAAGTSFLGAATGIISPFLSPNFHDTIGGDLGTESAQQGIDAISKAREAQNKKELYGAIGSTAGILVGSSLHGKNKEPIGSQIGSQIGALAGSFLPLPPGVGQFVGGVVGGLIGGIIGPKKKPNPPETIALEKIAANTGEQVTLLENTNKLLELSGLSFNIPSSFVLPRYNPSSFGGLGGAPAGLTANTATVSNTVSVEVNIAGSSSSPSEIGAMVAQAVSDRLDSEYRTGGRYVSRSKY